MRTLRERRGAGAARKQVKQVSEMRGLDEAPAARLSRAALAFRAAHATIALEQLLAIAYVWWCALSGRRGRLLRVAAATLIGKACWSRPTEETVRWAGCNDASATPSLYSSWCSRSAPRNWRCRRWGPSPQPGLFS
jgi:hypothetical protein